MIHTGNSDPRAYDRNSRSSVFRRKLKKIHDERGDDFMIALYKVLKKFCEANENWNELGKNTGKEAREAATLFMEGNFDEEVTRALLYSTIGLRKLLEELDSFLGDHWSVVDGYPVSSLIKMGQAPADGLTEPERGRLRELEVRIIFDEADGRVRGSDEPSSRSLGSRRSANLRTGKWRPTPEATKRDLG